MSEQSDWIPCLRGQLRRMVELSKFLRLSVDDWSEILAKYGVRKREGLSRDQADEVLGRLQARADYNGRKANS